MLKITAKNTEITIKNFFINVKSCNFQCRKNKLHPLVCWLISKKDNVPFFD